MFFQRSPKKQVDSIGFLIIIDRAILLRSAIAVPVELCT